MERDTLPAVVTLMSRRVRPYAFHADGWIQSTSASGGSTPARVGMKIHLPLYMLLHPVEITVHSNFVLAVTFTNFSEKYIDL
jgi:hypothetical protein